MLGNGEGIGTEKVASAEEATAADRAAACAVRYVGFRVERIAKDECRSVFKDALICRLCPCLPIDPVNVTRSRAGADGRPSSLR